MKKIYHANSNHQKVGVAIQILDKKDFKTTKNVTRDKERFIMTKGVNSSGRDNNLKHT